jgi:hypothetical protein
VANPSVIQSGDSGGSLVSSGSAATVLSSNTTLGNQVVLFIISAQDTINDVASVSSSIGTFTRKNAIAPSSSVDTETWICSNVTGASKTVTVTTTSGQVYSVNAYEIENGVTITSAGTNSGSSSAPVTSTLAFTGLTSGDLLVACCISTNSFTTTPATGGWTDYNGSDAAWKLANGFDSAYITASGSTATATWTNTSGSAVWLTLGVIISPTSTPAFVQGTAVNIGITGGSLTPALTGIAAGDTLVLSIANTSVTTGHAASAVSGGGAANWIYAGSVDNAIGVSDIWIGSNNTGSAGSQTVTVTLNGVSAVAGCELDEFSNIDLTNPLQTFSSSTGTSATITTSTLTPAETQDVPYFFSMATSTETASPSSPWAVRTGPTTSSAQRNGVAYQLGCTGGTGYSTTWTQTLGVYTVAGVVLNAIDVPVGINSAIPVTFALTATNTQKVALTASISVGIALAATNTEKVSLSAPISVGFALAGNATSGTIVQITSAIGFGVTMAATNTQKITLTSAIPVGFVLTATNTQSVALTAPLAVGFAVAGTITAGGVTIHLTSAIGFGISLSAANTQKTALTSAISLTMALTGFLGGTYPPGTVTLSFGQLPQVSVSIAPVEVSPVTLSIGPANPVTISIGVS